MKEEKSSPDPLKDVTRWLRVIALLLLFILIANVFDFNISADSDSVLIFGLGAVAATVLFLLWEIGVFDLPSKDDPKK